MAPRNLTWEEEVDDKLIEITRKRLELRIHLKEDKKLRVLKLFKKDLSYQFYLKNEYLRERDNLNSSEITPELVANQREIDKLEEEINKLSEEIQASSEKESQICDTLFHLKQDLRKFVERNVQERRAATN